MKRTRRNISWRVIQNERLKTTSNNNCLCWYVFLQIACNHVTITNCISIIIFCTNNLGVILFREEGFKWLVPSECRKRPLAENTSKVFNANTLELRLLRIKPSKRVYYICMTVNKSTLASALTLIPAWITYHMPGKVCDEITYPFPNFNGCTVEVWEWKTNFIPHFIMDLITYPCWDWHVGKRGPRFLHGQCITPVPMKWTWKTLVKSTGLGSDVPGISWTNAYLLLNGPEWANSVKFE